MDGNVNTGIRRFSSDLLSARRRLAVGVSGTAQGADMGQLFKANDGIAEFYTALTGTTGAVASTRANYDDSIDIASNFTTAVAAADLITLETNGVHVRYLGPRMGHAADYLTHRATAALPASATGSIFTVTGRVRLVEIIGTVTTVIQTQACNLKITSTPSAAGLSAVDLCSVLNVSANAVNTFYTITGTLANALINNAGAAISQAGGITIPAGTIDLITSATNTGSVKWQIRWLPLELGARVFAF